MIRLGFIFLATLITVVSVAQTGYYSVIFKDKACNTNLKPSDFLSSKSLERRERSQVSIKLEDYPLCTNYIHQISEIDGVTLKNKLKWNNEISISVSNADAINQIQSFSFVKLVKHICAFPISSRSIVNKFAFEEPSYTPSYGKSKTQMDMIGMINLHQKSFTGKGMLIAVFDNGFRLVDTMKHFQHLWKNGQIKGFRDYVNHNDSVFYGGSHGMSVLSTMTMKTNGEMIGTAPNADYYLMITEDNSSETLLEEYNWAEAAEFADSLGVDVINSSLGYTTFDDSTTNHTYTDMDGNTTIVTKAANKAFEKGILVVNSAGNSGNKNWKYIGAPADGYGVLSIGAVDSVEVLASFSSRGPTSKGVTKPDVCAMGSRVYVLNTKSEVNISWGTSFSGPIIAGSAACLWAAHPEMSNKTLMEVIRKSAHLYSTPNNNYGYGIPNFNAALQIAENSQKKEDVNNGFYNDFKIYPSPAIDFTTLEFVISAKSKKISIEVFNLQGALILSNDFTARQGHNFVNVDCSNLNAGLYIVRLVVEGEIFTKNFVVVGKVE